MNQVFDVIIVGAGSVGLLFAKELSSTHNVLLIDSQKIPSLQKSWFVPKTWVDKAGLKHFINHTLTKCGMYSINHRSSVKILPEAYYGVALNEKKLYGDILKQLRENGCKVLPNTKILKYRYRKAFIQASSKNETFTGRLFLDCSGVNSTFLKKAGNIKHEFYWSVFGIKYDGYNTDKNLTYLAAHIDNYQGYKVLINDVPEGKGHYTPWLYIMSPDQYSIEEMKNLYEKAVKSRFLKDKIGNHKPLQEKWGWIPACDHESRASKQLLSLGDAGAMAPWSNAMSFSLAVKNLKLWSDRLKQCLDQDKLDEESLNKVISLSKIEELNFDIGKLIFMLLMNTTADEFDTLVRVFDTCKIETMIKGIVFSDATFNEILPLIKMLVKYFTPAKLIEILGRDGFADEIKISSEILKELIAP